MSFGGELTVKFYRDKSSYRYDPAPAIAGVERLKEHFPPLKIIETHQLITVGDPHSDVLKSRELWTPWPKVSADMNFILTDRPIIDGVEENEGYEIAGQTYKRLVTDVSNLWRKPFTIIDISDSDDFIQDVAVHEGSHMLRLKEFGRYHDGDIHCTHPECILQAKETPGTKDLCYECHDQLDRKAYNLTHKLASAADMLGQIGRDGRRHAHIVKETGIIAASLVAMHFQQRRQGRGSHGDV